MKRGGRQCWRSWRSTQSFAQLRRATDLVAAAVAKGCNVNETDAEENPYLHLAAAQGSICIHIHI
jgi:hypothetical protein